MCSTSCATFGSAWADGHRFCCNSPAHMNLKGVFMRGQGYLLAAALALASWSAAAQDIGVGLIVPLSAPGDATGGQLIRRGAEIGVDMINAQGGVLGKKLKLYVQDSQ